MLLMAVSGAVVLALVCWTLLNEPPPSFTPFIPHPDSGERAGRAASAPDDQAPHPGGGTVEPDSGQDVADSARGHVAWEPADEADGGESGDDRTDLPRDPH
jgi:hypothetical protein